MESKLFKRIIPVGIGVIVLNQNNEILLGKRIIEDGENLYATHGGFLELNETFLECAQRETLEETGILLKEIKYFGVTHTVLSNDNHVDIVCVANVDSLTIDYSSATDKEVDKWEWIPLDIIENVSLWAPCKSAIDLYLRQINYLEVIYEQ